MDQQVFSVCGKSVTRRQILVGFWSLLSLGFTVLLIWNSVDLAKSNQYNHHLDQTVQLSCQILDPEWVHNQDQYSIVVQVNQTKYIYCEKCSLTTLLPDNVICWKLNDALYFQSLPYQSTAGLIVGILFMLMMILMYIYCALGVAYDFSKNNLLTHLGLFRPKKGKSRVVDEEEESLISS